MFRFDELLSMGSVTLACSGFVGVIVGPFAHARAGMLVASISLLVIAAVMILLRRRLRLQARAELMSWLPQPRPPQAKVGWGGDWQGLWRRDGALADDHSGGLHVAHPESNDAATRAVMASLNDALRADLRDARSTRPACRRARLRQLGRDSSFRSRRRSPFKRADSPS